MVTVSDALRLMGAAMEARLELGQLVRALNRSHHGDRALDVLVSLDRLIDELDAHLTEVEREQ